MLTALLPSCGIFPAGVGMSLAIVERLLGVDMMGLITGDGMGDEYAECDCGDVLAMSSHAC